MDASDWKAVWERKVRLLRAKPGFAKSTQVSVARLGKGLSCEIRSGEHVLHADVPTADAGEDSGPTPGQIMRSGVAGCLAIGYRQWAARLGVPLTDVEVEVACEIDARGQLGMGEGVPARWQRIAYTVRLTSDADESALHALVEHADRVSPMLDNLDKAIELARTIEIRRAR